MEWRGNSSSDSEAGVDLVALAKQRIAGARAASHCGGSSGQVIARSAIPAKPATASSAPSTNPVDSDSDDGLDLVTLAKQHNRAAASLVGHAPSPMPHGTTSGYEPAAKPAAKPVMMPVRPATTAGASSTLPQGTKATAAATPPQADNPQLEQRAPTAAAPTLLDLAVAEDVSLLLPEGGSAEQVAPPLGQGAAHITSPQPAAVPQPLPDQPTQQIGPAAGSRRGFWCAPSQTCRTGSPAATVRVANSDPSSPSGAMPMASMADLGDLISGVVGEVASTLRSDISRLEAGWQARWQEQVSSTADLCGRLDVLHASSTTQMQEVQGQIQGMATELVLHSKRLEAVERRQEQQAQVGSGDVVAPPSKPDHCACALPAAVVIAKPVQDPAPPTAAKGDQGGSSMPSVEVILRRLSLLEDRVGQQLHHIGTSYATGGSGSPRSAPASPLKPRAWAEQEHGNVHDSSPASVSKGQQESCHREPRMARAAAVAGAAVYGRESQTMEQAGYYGDKIGQAWGSNGPEESMLGSPRIKSSCLARPGSAAARYGGPAASRQSKEVDQQVSVTHAIISQIQAQIAAIKSSLAQATCEIDARHLEAGGLVQRLDQLELTDRYMASAEVASIASTHALERRVRSLEGRLAAVSKEAVAGVQAAKEVQAGVAALAWRVDKTSDATIGTIKALELRQDKLRSELRSTAAAATLADAKAATLAAEVARVQRRMRGSPGKSWLY